jgi:hypothetical protein
MTDKNLCTYLTDFLSIDPINVYCMLNFFSQEEALPLIFWGKITDNILLQGCWSLYLNKEFTFSLSSNSQKKGVIAPTSRACVPIPIQWFIILVNSANSTENTTNLLLCLHFAFFMTNYFTFIHTFFRYKHLIFLKKHYLNIIKFMFTLFERSKYFFVSEA